MSHSTTSRARLTRRLLTGAATVAVVGTFVAAPAAAFAAGPSDNGGSSRHGGQDQTEAVRESLVNGPAKNVILLIGDGMGDSEITVARNYVEGAGGSFPGIDALPLTGQYTTYALNKDGTPNYASESASTASGWSTGTKTYNGALSVDIAGKPQSTLLEIAKANGLKTGNVSTAEIQDATPGAQIAHISARGCYGPVATTKNCSAEALENGGLGSISEQLLNLRPDVVLGGGSTTFGEKAAAGQWKDQTLFEQATDRGYQLVDDAAGLNAVTAADQTTPVLGLFTPGNFPTRWVGPEATVGGGNLPAARCTPNPARLETGLSLASLTTKAIDLLAEPKADGGQGFFLQVEGASIDKRDHAADACGQIGETVDLDEAVKVALDYAKKDGNTLVVVTADHAHTSQILGSTPPGLSASLLTTEGQKMIVGYGTANAGESQQHTGSQVRIAGYGPGAANVVGLSDQTDLFFTSANALELKRDLKALSTGATATPSATTVRPGADLTVTAAGFNADWQLDGVLASDPVDLGDVDTIDGGAVYAVTAPTELGTHTVTLTGAQTGVTATATFTVAADAPATPIPSETTTPAAVAPVAGNSASGPLALTGSTIAPFALAALALMAAGTVLAARRRLRRAGSLTVTATR